MRYRFVATLVVASLSSLVTSSLCFAQPLADRVPDDALLYVGWKGHASPESGYAGSHLEAVLNASQYQRLYNVELPKLMALLADDGDSAKQVTETALSIARPFFRHPTAIFLRPGTEVDIPVRFGVVCRAGADAKALATQLRELIAKDEDASKQVRVIESGEFVQVLIGYSEADAKGAETADRVAPLASASKFITATKTAGSADPFIAMYVDVQAGLVQINQAVERENPEGMPRWVQARAALGLDGLHRVLIAGNFSGKDWSTTSFVQAPAPRKGIVKLIEGRPLEADVMKMIPATAGSAQVFRFDLAALVNEVRNVVAAVDPEEGAANFDRGVGAAQMTLAAHPIKDLLEPMGDTWLLFSDENIAGNTPEGLVLVNTLDDAAAATKGFSALWGFVTNMINARAADQIKLAEQIFINVRVQTAQTEAFTVGWTIANDKLVFGMQAEGIAKAASATAPAKGFDQNEKFAQMSKRLSNGNAISSFRYADLPVTTPIMHAKISEAWTQLLALADGQDIHLPKDLLPSIDVVMAHVSPMADVFWTDAAGFHARSHSPFPGADSFSNAPNSTAMTAGSGGLLAGILLPSLNRARETANRIKCASNQRALGQAMLLYSNEHNGDYPPDLGTLLLTQDVTGEVFICPSSDNALPENWNDMTPQQMADWVTLNSSYVYAAPGLKVDAPAERVLLYENEDNHGGDGLNFLYGDGHVEFQLMRDATKLIDEVKGK